MIERGSSTRPNKTNAAETLIRIPRGAPRTLTCVAAYTIKSPSWERIPNLKRCSFRNYAAPEVQFGLIYSYLERDFSRWLIDICHDPKMGNLATYLLDAFQWSSWGHRKWSEMTTDHSRPSDFEPLFRLGLDAFININGLGGIAKCTAHNLLSRPSPKPVYSHYWRLLTSRNWWV